MNALSRLENDSLFTIREAFARLKPVGLLWSAGKESNALIWLARKAFFGRVPFPVIQLDTGEELPELYEFRDRFARDLGLDLIVQPCPEADATDPALAPHARAAARKALGLKAAIRNHGLRGVLAGIRRDKQGSQAQERLFSPRAPGDPGGGRQMEDQPPEFWGHYATDVPDGWHVQVHPLLAWSELDIWRYTRDQKIPVGPPYLMREGQRYRSLDETGIAVPVAATAAATAACIDAIIADLETAQIPKRTGHGIDDPHADTSGRSRLEDSP